LLVQPHHVPLEPLRAFKLDGDAAKLVLHGDHGARVTRVGLLMRAALVVHFDNISQVNLGVVAQVEFERQILKP
jgi:hypothetical protein